MKKFLLISIACLVLAGCSTTTSPVAQKIAANINNAVTSVKDNATTIQAKAKVAQSYAAQICSYVPTIASVVAIINSGFSADVGVVANAICNAVTSIPLADGPGDRKPRVNGVVIKGNFIK
jgi:hypothetical protein